MQHTHQGQPCTTRECQEAALAAMRASAGNAGPSGTSGNAADLQKPGLEPLRAGGGGGAIRASAASPPATPGSASAFASAGGSGSLGSPPSPANTKGVRFSDEAERDNLHVGLPDSRSSSMVSPPGGRGANCHSLVTTANKERQRHMCALFFLSVFDHPCCTGAGLAAPGVRRGSRRAPPAAHRVRLQRDAHRGWVGWVGGRAAFSL